MTNLEFQNTFESELTTWVRWPQGGFDVELKYLSMGASERLVKDCQIHEWDPKTHQRVDRMDDEKFKRKLSDLIVNWRGLTVDVAKKFINLREGTPDDGEFPCTQKAKLFVIGEFQGFPSFILDSAKELHRLKDEATKEEAKNS